MTQSTFALAAAGLIASAALAGAHAQTPRLPAERPISRAPASLVPTSGFFVGVGGGLSKATFGTQDVYAVGTSNVYNGGVLTSSGSAAGPASVPMADAAAAGFSVQGGYFQAFPDSPWLWGAKFSYSYLGASSAVRNALLPQTGSFLATGGVVPTPFTGNAVVRSFENKITHQISLIPFIGHRFDTSFVYVGAGPTLSRVQTDLNGLIGFADVNGGPTDVSGMPINLSSASWVYGGAATIGATYFLDSAWFLDFSFTVAMTANHTASFSSPFTNPNGTGGSTITGTLVGTSAGKVITQTAAIVLNRAF